MPVPPDEKGWESWQWDQTLFAGAAAHYVRGRFPYAEGLAAAFASALALDGKGRLLDVGCGPGVVALRLAHLFEQAVGVDADAAMVDEAVKVATERGVRNATFVHRRAEQLPAGLGAFRVVSFAASFHWMDRPMVARTVKGMLEPGGAVVHVDTLPREGGGGDGPHPAEPLDAIADLRRRYLGPDTRAGQGVRNSSPSGEDEVFQAAGFAPAEAVVVPDGRLLERDVDDIVAHTFSSSPTAPHLFGERLGEFEADLRKLLIEVSPRGLFSARLPDNRLRIWRPRSGG